MADNTFKCRFCDKPPFPNSRALTQHLQRNKLCRQALEDAKKAPAQASIAPGMLTCIRIHSPPKRQFKSALGTNPDLMCNLLGANNHASVTQQKQDQLDYSALFDQNSHSDEDSLAFMGDDEDEDDVELTPHLEKLRNSVLLDFREYRQEALDCPPLTKKHVDAINLMFTLRKTKASLETYDSIMEWHLKATGAMHEHESVTLCDGFISRDKLFTFLRKRYNMEKGHNIPTEIILPYSKARAKIICNDAGKMIQSLLTDPRIKATDYLFFDNNNPFAPPQEDLSYIGDLNTGKAYIETWHKLITNPNKQILVPVPIYIDGTVTGQFAHLPITPVKISLGIFTREARDRDYMWRTLGYIPATSREKARGKRLLIDSGHVDGTMPYLESLEDEGQVADKNVVKAQDMHTILATILEGFVEIQKAGLRWDLQIGGRVFRDVEFKFFVPFIKADTEEADKLCGSFLARTRNVAQLCRYCECPTAYSDQPLAKYPYKTPKKIGKLVSDNDIEALKALSQQPIKNATYALRFGAHNSQGVHGACPMDMLHHIYLGIFKNIRDCFFEQLGENSQVAEEADALAKEYGVLFSRQSERDMPKMKFSKGIRDGKLTGKEYVGVILLMLAVLRSSLGRPMVQGARQFKKDPNALPDWIMMLETLLEFQSWMKSPPNEEATRSSLGAKAPLCHVLHQGSCETLGWYGAQNHQVSCHSTPSTGHQKLWCAPRNRLWFQ